MERKIVERRLLKGWISGLVGFVASLVAAILPPTRIIGITGFWIHGSLSFWGYVLRAGLVLVGTVLVLMAWRNVKAGKTGYKYGLAGAILLLLNVGEVSTITTNEGVHWTTFNAVPIICFIAGIYSIIGAVESGQVH